METNKIATLLVVLVVGMGAGYLWGASKTAPMSRDMHMMPDGTMMNEDGMGMGNAMEDMITALKGLNGDAFDQAFLREMIVHHEGAVAMAQAALRDAKHQELKNMANDIISAQTREIEQMRSWLKSWYSNE